MSAVGAVIAAFGIGAQQAHAADELPAPIVSASAGVGPTFALNQRPCGVERCRPISYALGMTGLVRVVQHLSLGASALYEPLGTVSPDLHPTAQGNGLLHLDLVARYHFLPHDRVSPWIQIGAGLATLFAVCTDGGPAPCNADPTLSTSDSVRAFSARAGGGLDYRVFRWLSFGGSLEIVGDFAGEGHVCSAGTCATSPGSHAGVVALFGAGVDAGKR